MHRAFLLIIAIILATSVFSQNENTDIAVYENVKIRLINGKSSNVKKLKLVNDTTITFLNPHTLQQTNLNISQVKELWEKKGNYIVGYAAFGGTVGLLTNLYALAMSNAEYGSTLPLKTTLPIITGFTLGAAGIGAFIGWCFPPYTKISFPTSSKSTSIFISPSFNNQSCGISFVYQLK